jgi:A/G-specific adenine glycosylase
VARIPDSGLALSADLVGLRAALLAWFDRDGRALAFRVASDPDPWAVLVSEVMAQQTQVARVAEKWRAFMDRFPTPASLASASTGDAIRAWQGLGYNRRAIGLQRAARAIVDAGGLVPRDVESLRSLPGVGPYTARAVAAIAFGVPVGAVDVNVRRVVSRLGGAGTVGVAERDVQAAADAAVDPARAGDWTHALMDLGATICRPARPACAGGPVSAWCPFPKAPAARGRPAADPQPQQSLPGAVAARRRRTAVPFETTTRWLRGRIVDRLCSLPPGTSVTFDGPLGLHAPEAVSAALASLAADGLVELDGISTVRLAGDVR